MIITITINKDAVMREIAQTTSYAGAKMEQDATAYERIYTTDEDRSQLERFWDEARAEMAQRFMRLLQNEGEIITGDGLAYQLKLLVSDNFEGGLVPSMEKGVFSFFVQSISGKWFEFTNKKESAQYLDRAKELIEEVREKAFYKKKPTRPTYG